MTEEGDSRCHAAHMNQAAFPWHSMPGNSSSTRTSSSGRENAKLLLLPFILMAALRRKPRGEEGWGDGACSLPRAHACPTASQQLGLEQLCSGPVNTLTGPRVTPARMASPAATVGI